jgi:ADP-heptose:LPS heptosyltransferase
MRVARAIARSLSSALTSPRTARTLAPLLFALTSRNAADREMTLHRTRSILTVRLDEIGDVVLTSPFLRELRCNAPQAWITLIVKPEIKALVELCPYVNEVLTFDSHAAPRFKQLRLHARALGLTSKALWRRHFDLAILPRWDVDYYHSTFLAYFSGAACRAGYSEKISELKQRQNSGFDSLLTHVLDDRAPKHEVERNLNVLRFLGAAVKEDQLELWLGPEDRAFAEQMLASLGIRDSDLLLACAPGAGAAKRRWPIERFIDLGRRILRDFDLHVVVVGGADDRKLGSRLQQELGARVINLAGEATLRQTAAVLERTQLMVTNDAGPMHLAAAAGSSVVEISCHPRNGATSHANSPTRFRPWGVPHVVLQPERAAAPCQEACEAPETHCILGIEVECVEHAVRSLLSSKTRTAASCVGARHDQ